MNTEYTQIGTSNERERYERNQEGVLYHVEVKESKDGVAYEEKTPIANHTPLLDEYRTVDNGIEATDEIVFHALRNYKHEKSVSLTFKDMLTQEPNLKFGAPCIIKRTRGAKLMYREAMQIQCEDAPHTVLYTHTGFTVIDGKRVFLNGDYSITADGLTDVYSVLLPQGLNNYKFTDQKHTERYSTLLNLLPQVAPETLIYTGLAYTFLTPLNALLRSAGVEPRFILYFIGKTGSRKTTIANVFLSFFGTFGRGTPSPAGFRDTANAIEKVFALTDSTLILLDDRIPATTQAEKTKMESIEQAIARQIGDRSGRTRMNPDGTLKPTYTPRCNVITTAEEAYGNVGESAIARSISVELLPNDVDLNALTQVQHNAGHLNECMTEYIQYIIVNWDAIETEVKGLFEDLRNRAQAGEHGRLAECVAHLQIGIIYFCRWLVSVNQMSAADAAALQDKAFSIFMELADRQNRRITEEKPVKLFLDAVKSMYGSGSIRVKNLIDNSSNTHGITSANGTNIPLIGYSDTDYFYFYGDEIYSAVRRFYDAQGKNFPLSKSALFRQLEIDNVIISGKGQYTKQKRIDGKTKRLLWIKAQFIEEGGEADEHGET